MACRFKEGYFYGTDDIENMCEAEKVKVIEELQRELSEAQRIIRAIESKVLQYKQ